MIYNAVFNADDPRIKRLLEFHKNGIPVNSRENEVVKKKRSVSVSFNDETNTLFIETYIGIKKGAMLPVFDPVRVRDEDYEECYFIVNEYLEPWSM